MGHLDSGQFRRGYDLNLLMALLRVYQIHPDASRPIHQVPEIPAQQHRDPGYRAGRHVPKGCSHERACTSAGPIQAPLSVPLYQIPHPVDRYKLRVPPWTRLD